MRVLHCLALAATLAALTGCACLPGGGKATNALSALKPQQSPIVAKDEIPRAD
jgi:hypothetical protein